MDWQQLSYYISREGRSSVGLIEVGNQIAKRMENPVSNDNEITKQQKKVVIPLVNTIMTLLQPASATRSKRRCSMNLTLELIRSTS